MKALISGAHTHVIAPHNKGPKQMDPESGGGKKQHLTIYGPVGEVFGVLTSNDCLICARAHVGRSHMRWLCVTVCRAEQEHPLFVRCTIGIGANSRTERTT